MLRKLSGEPDEILVGGGRGANEENSKYSAGTEQADGTKKEKKKERKEKKIYDRIQTRADIAKRSVNPWETSTTSYCTINGTTTHRANLKIYIADFEASFVPLRCVHCFTKTKNLGVSFVSVFWKGKPPRFFGLVFLENGEEIREKNPGEMFLG